MVFLTVLMLCDMSGPPGKPYLPKTLRTDLLLLSSSIWQKDRVQYVSLLQMRHNPDVVRQLRHHYNIPHNSFYTLIPNRSKVMICFSLHKAGKQPFLFDTLIGATTHELTLHVLLWQVLRRNGDRICDMILQETCRTLQRDLPSWMTLQDTYMTVWLLGSLDMSAPGQFNCHMSQMVEIWHRTTPALCTYA